MVRAGLKETIGNPMRGSPGFPTSVSRQKF
jgi:hypothetical protein